MKIAFLQWFTGAFDLIHPGGILLMSLRQAEELNKLGHTTHIFGQDPVGEHSIARPLSSYRLAGRRRRLLSLAEYTMRTWHYDILHGANHTFLARRFPKRAVVHFHNVLPLDSYQQYKAAYHQAHYIFCSNYVQQAFQDRYPDVPQQHCHVIHNAVDLAKRPLVGEHFSGGDKTKSILFAAAWTREKGIDLLPRIIVELRKLRPLRDYKWIVAGSTDFWSLEAKEAQRINRLVYTLNEEYSNVEIVGKCTHHQIMELMTEADVFVSPVTWEEPFGLTIAEAMSHAIPVVATASGGIPELVEHERNGLLIPFAEPEPFARAINELLDQTDKRQNLGQTARETIERNFNWNVHLEKLLHVYRLITS